jgi:polyisoprenyl-phosphate glycosyltransferase
MPKLSIIIPCYYNGANMPSTSKQLLENEALFSKDTDFEYIMVDDGSKDDTFEQLTIFQSNYPTKVKAIKLAANVGPHNAVQAGMKYATGDACIIIAADLQDPPELIVKMLEHWRKGFKLVMANRQDREESWGQKLFANTYHSLIKKFALPNLPDGGFDFVLFDKEIKDKILEIKEKNTNVLYLMLWMGYDYVNIPYTRRKREIGKSRWTLSKKVKLFVDSFVAFSYLPLRLISTFGLLLGSCALIYAFFILFAKLTGQIQVEGWSTMMVIFLFVSAFQMMALGIIGEYVWRTLDASRNRPLYVIDKVLEQQ